MVSRKIKAAFYSAFGPIMSINGVLFKYLFAPKSNNKNLIKVHLGPGQDNYLEKWINVDANAFTGRVDVWADLRNPLPFKDNSVDVFYSHHVIEHLPDLDFHFNEMYRCLKIGGIIRVGGPNGEGAAMALLNNDKEWFLQGKSQSWPTPRKSIGGMIDNFIFCKGEHLKILTPSFLKELTEDAGFSFTGVINSGETNFPELIKKEVFDKETNPNRTIIVEAQKE